MSSEFTQEERAARVAAQPPQDQAQPRKAAPASKWQELAQRPEKVLFQIWVLLALGIVIRVITPMLASGGIMVISGTAVLGVLIYPVILAGVTLYYSKTITDMGRALVIGSAAVTTIFGIYLLIWAMS
jgi:hypothetical protein